jgi:hypothetical protein
MSDLIEQAITEFYGERCDDYLAECVVCTVWKEYDILTGNYEASKTELLKKMDNIIDMVRNLETKE